MAKKPKGGRERDERTHVEITLTTPVVWPREAYDLLEDQLKERVRQRIEGEPEGALRHRIDQALTDLFFGLRTTKPGIQAIVATQEIGMKVEVVDQVRGKVTRRRRLENLNTIEVTWP